MFAKRGIFGVLVLAAAGVAGMALIPAFSAPVASVMPREAPEVRGTRGPGTDLAASVRASSMLHAPVRTWPEYRPQAGADRFYFGVMASRDPVNPFGLFSIDPWPEGAGLSAGRKS